MQDPVKLSWSALEYEERERSPDWFWALAVVAVTSAITSIIYSNYFFALFILISGGLLWVLAHRPPETVTYELTDKGLRIKSHIYLYENIQSFWVQREGKPMLFVKTQRFFMPVFSIPMEYGISDQTRGIFLSKGVPEEEMKEHPSEKIIDTLGF